MAATRNQDGDNISVLLTIVTIVVGIVVFGIEFPEFATRVFTLAVVLLVGAFCFSACGIMIANIVPNEEAAPAIINPGPNASA